MLKIVNFKKKEKESFIEFFIRYFKDRPATVDAETLELQCEAGRLRTYKDLYRIFQFYFPGCSEDKFKRTLQRLISYKYINAVYCGEIEDVTFYPYAWCGKEEYTRYCSIFISFSGSGNVYFADQDHFDYVGYAKDAKDGKVYEFAKFLGAKELPSLEELIKRRDKRLEREREVM
jgi:hypothetical protein